ncbi:Mannitol 1-phosphate dehydrogenase [Mycena chlorophos]|uniref:Mannitol 1-phosphate dehydrogenase n=1 Tax=Mycena chlorophos TaxID=658473 RepID=A0A8H6S314_MYCCL|nr:Mannitol 1-phosphate dehydrogenase [Mycena chlorophos]
MAAQQLPSIAIVGGGIAGLTLALNLIELSTTTDASSSPRYTITIYESAQNFSEIGAGVAFGPNAVLAMKSISPAVYAAFEKTETTNQTAAMDKDLSFHAHFGETVEGRYEENEFICTLYCDGGQRGVRRSDFLDELVKSIPDGVAQFGKRVTHYTNNSDGVLLHFTDGTTARHDAVLGCDGIKSSIRKTMLAATPEAIDPVFSGKFCYRGLIPMDVAVAALGPQAAQNAHLYLGRGGHLVTFAIAKGRLMNVVVFDSAKEWTDADWVVPADPKAMQERFAGWSPTVTKILSIMRTNDIWALFDQNPAPTFVSEDGRVCLVGDAAHATTPHRGAGAGMAVEDAYILGNLISQALVATPGPDAANAISAALRVYDAVRRERGLRLVKESRETGILYELEDPELGADKEKIRARLLTMMHWIWDHDVREELKVASEQLAVRLQ